MLSIGYTTHACNSMKEICVKENNTGKKSFTRSRLVKELSWTCELPQTKVSAILASLAELARREAPNTFVLPGICKLEVVRRKPRKMRNPRTGDSFMLPERDALKITAPRSLKLACAKVIEPAATPAEPVADAEKPAETKPAETTPAETTPTATAAETVAATTPAAETSQPTTPAPATEAAAATEAAPAAKTEPAAEPPPVIDPNVFISFRCPRCHQEVEASGDMVGLETECPACGNPMIVPSKSEEDTIHSAAPGGEGDGPVRHAQTVSSREAESLSPEKLKGLTIRIDVGDLGLDTPQEAPAEVEIPPEQMISFVCNACKQEVEASRDLIGETLLCPGCGAPITVPEKSVANTLHDASQENDPKVAQAMKGRTMRIDIGDDF